MTTEEKTDREWTNGEPVFKRVEIGDDFSRQVGPYTTLTFQAADEEHVCILAYEDIWEDGDVLFEGTIGELFNPCN